MKPVDWSDNKLEKIRAWIAENNASVKAAGLEFGINPHTLYSALEKARGTSKSKTPKAKTHKFLDLKPPEQNIQKDKLELVKTLLNSLVKIVDSL